MQVKIKGEFLGSMQQTNKGGYIRQFLCLDPVGNKAVIKLYQAVENCLDLRPFQPAG